MKETHTQPSAELPFLQGGGEMGHLIRNLQWSGNPLGTPSSWHPALQQTVSMMLKSNFPMLICWGTDYTQLYNDAFRPINGQDKHPQAVGSSARTTYAEIWETIGPMFADVMRGHTHGFPDFKVPLERNGFREDCYFDFSYSPITALDGQVMGILVVCIETTEKVRSIQKLEEARKEAELNLIHLREMVWQAPVAMCILLGPEHVITVANQRIIDLWGKPERTVMNRPVFEALPDARGQGLEEVMAEVYRTGETFTANEMPVELLRNGQKEIVYQNFVYAPYRQADGQVAGVIAITVDVTKQVEAQQALQRSNSELNRVNQGLNIANQRLADTGEMLNMAIDAANLGIWRADIGKDSLNISERARIIHGIPPGQEITFTNALKLIDQSHQSRVAKGISEAVRQHREFNEEYPINPANGSGMRWLSTAGKAHYDESGKPLAIIGTLLDITERKQDEIRKNDFIGMVSHELKTPLTSLNATVQIAHQKLATSEDPFLGQLMVNAARQLRKMTTMINGFLNVSRLESGKILIDKQPFALDDLVREIIEEISLLGKSHQISLAECPPVMIAADRDKIGSVVSNLLSNAIKYSPRGTTITVECHTRQNEAEVSIRDQGIGIKPEDAQHLFERYYRVHDLNRQHISGFGIGLYLSAEIIHRHGGRIWVNSSIGEGSVFYFSLPLTEPE